MAKVEVVEFPRCNRGSGAVVYISRPVESVESTHPPLSLSDVLVFYMAKRLMSLCKLLPSQGGLEGLSSYPEKKRLTQLPNTLASQPCVIRLLG